MSNLALPSDRPMPLPLPALPLTVRPATLADMPFMDSLQKLHSKQVGWMPTKQFEGKIAAGHVIIAENEERQPVGYCIGHDQYFKRDDVGIIYQMNVLPMRQRGLVGATLLQAMFERAAYGCKLFCCWCAQDIAANHFWQSMGFVPLAYRAGSEKKARVHIFWQKRIRRGYETTPWWFPAKTDAGAMREDRLVFPIPPGTHWSDVKSILLPGAEPAEASPALCTAERKCLPGPRPSNQPGNPKAIRKPPSITAMCGLRFAVVNDAASQEKKPDKKPHEPRRKVKADPRLIAAARELRDRCLERVNACPMIAGGKYDVSRSRQIATDDAAELPPARLLIEARAA